MALRVTKRELLEYRRCVYGKANLSECELRSPYVDLDTFYADSPGDAKEFNDIDLLTIEVDSETYALRVSNSLQDLGREHAMLDYASKRVSHRANFLHEIKQLGLSLTHAQNGTEDALESESRARGMKLNY